MPSGMSDATAKLVPPSSGVAPRGNGRPGKTEGELVIQVQTREAFDRSNSESGETVAHLVEGYEKSSHRRGNCQQLLLAEANCQRQHCNQCESDCRDEWQQV